MFPLPFVRFDPFVVPIPLERLAIRGIGAKSEG